MKTTIIVTVKSTDAALPFNYDMEIPIYTPFATLGMNMVELIRQERPGIYGGALKGELYSERLRRKMEPGETPMDAGMWNGDILRIC